MGISIIVGGQYGSEGKGKVAYCWAKKMKAKAAVRVGGSNSGHIVYDENNKKYAFRMLPTAVLQEGIVAVLPAGAYLDLSVLMAEISRTGIAADKLKIDPNAVVIKEEYKEVEESMKLRNKVGSTLSGTGAAVIARIKRDTDKITFAKDIPELQPYLDNTKTYLRTLLDAGEHIVIEGTQGYGLSNYHSEHYPYVTSRDTTAAAFLAETGLSPFDVEHIVLVIRAFPIRVAGNSGPLKNEIDWQTVSDESGSETYVEEKTTVTGNVRRVARFDEEIVKAAICANNPDYVVLNHVDYIDYENQNNDSCSKKQRAFVHSLEELIERKIDFVGNGLMHMMEFV